MKTKMNTKRALVFLFTISPIFSEDRKTQNDEANFRYGQVNVNHCITPSGASGECIWIKKCPPLMTLLRNRRQDQTVERLLLDSKCGGEGRNTKVCCLVQSDSTVSTQVLPQRTIELPSSPECGNSEMADAVRIHGGHPADLGAWPWIAALGYRNLTHSGPMWGCGGSIINIRFILTAAHCIKEPKLILSVIRLGELDLANETEGATPIDFGFVKTIAHEGYHNGRKRDDIGLIKLDRDITFSRYIKPICIPKPPELRSKNYEGYSPFVIGWGAVDFEVKYSDQLLQAQLPVVSNTDCKRLFANALVNVLPSHICAGYLDGRVDACMGDSGGPLMYPHGKTYYIIGIVSFGMRCGRKGYPGIYTRVTEYINWIESKIEL